MTNELISLIALHFACSDISETRMLSAGEVEACGAIYQKVKLSFVPDMDAEAYHTLPISEQVEINRQGFLAYIEWKRDNPFAVQQIEAISRTVTDLGETV